MRKRTFEDRKLALAESCEFLRSFTLGRHGFTRQDGIAAIQRVTDQCDQMEKLYAVGSDAIESKTIVASIRSKVSAAKARLAILRKVL